MSRTTKQVKKKNSTSLSQDMRGGGRESEWDKNWQAGTMSAVRKIGDYQNKLPQGFKDRLNNVKKHHPYAQFDKI